MVDSTDRPGITAIALPVTSWSFETRKVQCVDIDTLRVKPGAFALAFSALFVVLGLALAAFWFAARFTAFEGPGSIPLLLIGVLFVAAGLWTYHGFNEQVIVNRTTGVAFMRSWSLSMPPDSSRLSQGIAAQEIIAIQMISRVVKHRSNRSRRGSSYTEYQVNLCDADNERHNTLISLKPEKAEAFGSQLAQMFDVPLVRH
ncbi:MAG: hypothetical protein AB8B97_10490 [Granulosicoccus sp.]